MVYKVVVEDKTDELFYFWSEDLNEVEKRIESMRGNEKLRDCSYIVYSVIEFGSLFQ